MKTMHRYFYLLLLLVGFVENRAEISTTERVHNLVEDAYILHHNELVEMSKELDTKKFTKKELGEALVRAAHYSNLTVAQAFINAGADINYIDECRHTALIYAAFHNKLDMVREFIKAGANINYFDSFAKSALLVAVEQGTVDIVQELIRAGANINQVDEFSKTALLIAIENGKISIMQELIKAGANVNDVDAFGRNVALVTAIDNDKVRTLEKLLQIPGINVDSQVLMQAQKKGGKIFELFKPFMRKK